MINRVTWNTRSTPENAEEIYKSLKSANFPLHYKLIGDEDSSEDSSKSKICALVSYVNGTIDSYVVTPSGIVYRFNPPEIDLDWWSFALRYYYFVTGNLHDRTVLCELCNVNPEEVKGKTVIRKKDTELSNLELDEIFAAYQ